MTLWSVSGDHGNRWLNGQAPIRATSSYSVVIEGVRGSGLAGDIAIDDLSFGDTLCGGKICRKSCLGWNGDLGFITLSVAC